MTAVLYRLALARHDELRREAENRRRVVRANLVPSTARVRRPRRRALPRIAVRG